MTFEESTVAWTHAINLADSRTDSRYLKRERRRVARRALNLSIELHRESGIAQLYRATDISLGGMFIRGDGSLFKAKDIVEPEFWLDFGQLARRCHMVVQVVRVGEKGIGIGFHRHDRTHFRYVQKMMYELTHEPCTEEPSGGAVERYDGYEGAPKIALVDRAHVLSGVASGKDPLPSEVAAQFFL